MRRCKAYFEKRRRERELDLLNNPRRMVYVSDLLINAAMILAGVAIFIAALYGIGVIVEATNNLMGV